MNKIRGTLTSLIAGGAAAAGIALWQMSWLGDTVSGTWMAWSNGFFTIAVLWLGLGALTWIASFGGFDSLKYLGYVFKQKYFAKNPKITGYFDYKREQMENKERRPMRYLIAPGTVFLVIAAIAAAVSMR